MDIIDNFRGKYSYMSNFSDHRVIYKEIEYNNSEAAFQAQKFQNTLIQTLIAKMNPSEAKSMGRAKVIFIVNNKAIYKNNIPRIVKLNIHLNTIEEVRIKEDWDEIKVNEMYKINKAKYNQNPNLIENLLSTGNALLIEGNTWGDRFWGQVDGVGENHLGKVLMKIRDELRGE